MLVFFYYFLIMLVCWTGLGGCLYLANQTQSLGSLTVTTLVVITIVGMSTLAKMLFSKFYKTNITISFFLGMGIRFLGIVASLFFLAAYDPNNIRYTLLWLVFLYFVSILYDALYVEKTLE